MYDILEMMKNADKIYMLHECFEESHSHSVYQITKYQIWIDIQSEHNYVILSGIIQCINYMIWPLLGHHQVVLSLESNCIT